MASHSGGAGYYSSNASYAGSTGSGGGGGSYAARSAAAHAAHSSVVGGATSTYNAPSSQYGQFGGRAGAPITAPVAPPPPQQQQQGTGRSSHHQGHHQESPAELAHQSRLLTDATRRVQEHTYYMNKAMADDDGLPTVLEHAALMLSELGDPHNLAHNHPHRHSASQPSSSFAAPHLNSAGAASQLSPKSYYELHMRILNEMPNLEEYLLSLSSTDDTNPIRYSLHELYESVQYCPKVVPRLYLQICAGSALIRTNTIGTKIVLNDLIEAVKCVQCPLRGLFLRSYLLQALKDKLPDVPLEEKAEETFVNGNDNEVTSVVDTSILSESKKTIDNGTVKDALDFVLSNFIEMNKLWVRVQHISASSVSSSNSQFNNPKGNREARRRRERERNELRILVGTNLVRLSQLESITTAMYATDILPSILNQITSCRDPLAQAYLMDCIIQVFPDEFHIETLGIFLDVCPKLREKVNVRTIIQSIMERLSNYYADEMLLLDAEKEQQYKDAQIQQGGEEKALSPTKKSISENTVKKENSFQLLNSCIQNIVSTRKSTIPSKEIVRLQMALLRFTLKCYPGNMFHVNHCLASCATSLRERQSLESPVDKKQQHQHAVPPSASTTGATPSLDETTIDELEKLLSIPLESLALKVLQLDHYSDLLTFLPWENRRQVAVVMLKAVETSKSNLNELHQIEELFVILTPLILESNVPDSYSHGTFISKLEEEEKEEESQRLQQQEEEAATTQVNAEEHDKRTADLMGALGISNENRQPSSQRNLARSTLSKRSSSAFPNTNNTAALLSTAINFSVEEQYLLAKLIHLLHHDDTDMAYKMLVLAKQHLCRGGITARLRFTLPPIVFESLKLLKRVKKLEMVDTMASTAAAPTPVEETKKEEEEQPKVEEEETKEEGENAEEGEEDTKDEKEEEVTEDEAKSEEDEKEESSKKEEEEKASVVAPPVFTKKVNCRRIFLFVQKTIAMLAIADPRASFKLNLEAAISADKCAILASSSSSKDTNSDFTSISYEFITQAFQIYEDEISDSKAQQRSIEMIVGTLLSCKMFEKDDYEALITKTAQYAAKLLKKPDQCRMVTLVSHLFFTGADANDKGAYRNPQRVLECLQRALKIADACSMSSSANVQLFVEILEHYVYYFEKDNPVISDRFVSGLVALIKEHMESIGFSSSADQMVFAETQGHYRHILRYLQKKKDEKESAKKFANVVC